MINKARLLQQSTSRLDHSRLLTLINSMTDGFLATDNDGKIELSNSVALSLLDTNSLDGKNIKDAMPLLGAQDDIQNILELTAKSGGILITRDLRLKYKDGQIINVYLNVSQVRSVFGTTQAGYVVLFRDITKEKTEQDERDEFISVASHELRNPVAVIEGGISNALLLAQKEDSPETVLQVLKSAHEQALFLSGLINDLSMISRADREKFARSAVEFDPVEVLQSLQNDYSGQAQKNGLQIKLQAAQLPKIFGSKLYTREILQNFITNAIKYSQRGDILIEGKAAGDGVDLSVTDNGFGIDPIEQKKLFTKFFRSDDSRVRQINGTGLGLYVSLKLARLMGGNLDVRSELNHGSTFTLHLPAALPPKPLA